MSSTFFGLNIAYSGLLASNASLNTTANNISNVQTEGYSRQQVNQQASSPIRVFQTYGCAGAGVDTLSVERVRDDFYDSKYWNNNCKVGEYDIKQYYMEQIESYFDDDGKNAGFKTVFDQMMVTGLEELLKDPSSTTAKSQFIGYADALTEYFNGLSGNLQALQKDLNQEIKLKVDELNSLASEIATLNHQINTIELTNVNANELRDRRTVLLDKLSKIVDIEVTETPVIDGNNPDRETGANRCIVKIAGGQTLIDGNEYNALECRGRANYEKVNQTDIDGLYDVYWVGGDKFELTNAAMGGELRGLVQMRDGNNGENFSGVITSVGTTEDGKYDTVTVSGDAHYLQDLNKCNLSDQGGVIALGNQEFYYDSWNVEISFDDNGEASYAYTFTLSGTEKNALRVTNDRVGRTAEIGKSIEYQGVPYYMSQMNEWVRTFSQKVNDLLESGYDSNGDSGTKLFTGDHATDSNQFGFTADARYDSFVAAAVPGSSITVSVTSDSYYRLTAENFGIVSAIEMNSSLLANRYDRGDGVESSDLLTDLRDLATDKSKASFRGASASEFLQGVLSDIALNASQANSMSASYQSISATIDNQRVSISGVDEDEEAVNLVKFQNGYNLASKMIQVLSEIYDRLILNTGV